MSKVVHRVIKIQQSPIPLPEIEKPTCIICLDEHSYVLLPCNHSNTCGTCLARWWRESYHLPRCPICRTATTKVFEKWEDTTLVKDWFRWRTNMIVFSILAE